MPFSPLGKDFLTGEIDENTEFADDFRNIVPRFSPEARRANQDLLEPPQEIADAKGVTPAQIALAWVPAQKPWIVLIPGTTKRSHLKDNVEAADLELTSGELKNIERALSKIEIHGARYPEELEERTGR